MTRPLIVWRLQPRGETDINCFTPAKTGFLIWGSSGALDRIHRNVLIWMEKNTFLFLLISNYNLAFPYISNVGNCCSVSRNCVTSPIEIRYIPIWLQLLLILQIFLHVHYYFEIIMVIRSAARFYNWMSSSRNRSIIMLQLKITFILSEDNWLLQ